MKKIPLSLTLIAASLTFAAASSGAASPNVLDIKHTITDDAVIFPESFETDTQKMLDSWYLKNYTATDNRYQTMPDPDVTDETIRKRLAAIPTTIELPFNSIVRTYIDRYTKKGRKQVSTLLGLGIYYMPIFEQALEEEGLPLELKYLPVIESGLNPNAVSRHAATGLWQFMLATARGVGLEVNTLVDERRDPYASSRHAARYLHDLYDSYGDWSLAIAAYNCGPGAVNKAIRRAGGDPKSHDFWSIYEYLSPETRGYVPMFIAANYVMKYYQEHNISPVLPTKPLVTDTIHVNRRIHFDQISKVLSIPVDELRILNPQFRADVIPGTQARPYTLILPSQQALAYVMSEDNIAAYEADRYTRRTQVEPASLTADDTAASDDGEATAEEGDGEILTASHPDSAEEGAGIPKSVVEETQPAVSASLPVKTVTHTVASGETISDIADLYKVSVSDIRSWNSLRRNAVRVGQKLRIRTSVDVADAKTQKPAASASASSAQDTRKAAPAKKQTGNNSASSRKKTSKTTSKPVTHNIKSGENLTTIAKRYGVTVDQLRKANNLKGDNIRAGQSLKVPAKSTSSKSGKKRRR